MAESQHNTDQGLAIAIGFIITALICVLAATRIHNAGAFAFYFLAFLFGIIGLFGTLIEVSRSARGED